MTTSALLSKLYPQPSQSSKPSSTTFMQMLHFPSESRLTETSVLSGFYFSKPDQSSVCSLDPYLHRVYWVLSNANGYYLADLQQGRPLWVRSANDVPSAHRFSTYEQIKAKWIQLRDLLLLQDCSISVQPIDFYAHRSSPTSWCACDD